MFVTHDYEIKVWRFDYDKSALELIARIETTGNTLSEIVTIPNLQMFAYIERGLKNSENQARIATNEGQIIKEIKSKRYTAI
jgi:hypothetical protein